MSDKSRIPFNRLRLQSMRKRYQRTQERVSNDLDVPLRTYCAWELGETKTLTIENLRGLAKYWKVDMMYFVNPEVQEMIVELQVAYELAREAADPQQRFANALQMLKAHSHIFSQIQQDKIENKLDKVSNEVQAAIESVLGVDEDTISEMTGGDNDTEPETHDTTVSNE